MPPVPSPPQSGPRAHHLDGVRGTAALIVVLAHFCQMFLPAVFSASDHNHGLGERWFAMTPLNILVHGQMAVCIFFVLSGIVLSAPYFHTGRRSWYVQAAIKRYPRLALPAVGSTVLAWLLAITIGYRYGEVMPLTGATMPDMFAGINSLSTALWQGSIGAFFFGQDEYNKVLWTIGIEVAGSYLVFLVVPLAGGSWIRWLVYAALAWWLRDSHILAFVLGIAIADVLRKPTTWRVAGWPVFLIGLWAASLPYYGAQDSIWAPLAATHLNSKLTRIVGSAVLLIGVITVPSVRAIFSARPFQFLGRISFSLYLVHFSLWASLGTTILAMCSALPYGLALTIVFTLGLPAIIAVSVAFTRWVDEPSIRASAWLAKIALRPFARKTSVASHEGQVADQ